MSDIINFLKNNFYLIVLLILILLAWNVFLQFRLEKTRKRIKIFFKGRKTQDLEGVIAEQLKRTKKAEAEIKKLFDWNEKLQGIADISIQGVGMVRFNPFKDTGGDQSFAIALLDKNNNGVVISTLYSREGTRIYAKPIEKGDSSYHLSEEEKEAIQKAVK